MVAAVFELQIIDWVGSPYSVGPRRVLAGLKREAPDSEYSPRWGPLIEGSGATSLP